MWERLDAPLGQGDFFFLLHSGLNLVAVREGCYCPMGPKRLGDMKRVGHLSSIWAEAWRLEEALLLLLGCDNRTAR